MASDRKPKFGGLNPKLSPDKTPTGKPRYIFYVFDKSGTFKREVHANNLTAAAGAALKNVFKKNFNDRSKVLFLLGDKKAATGRKMVRASWLGRLTATLFPIFEEFRPVVKRTPAKGASKSGSYRTATKSKSQRPKTQKSKTQKTTAQRSKKTPSRKAK